ncbi:ubiquinol-cytochrome c reductase core subunit 1 [Kappamyces sp. JEL0680]|nr:ubiquinol-cytochrome c reductase core subunit 1 [Kappamyces sp. JEL0680]
MALVDVVPTLVSNLLNPSYEVYEFINHLEATAAQTASSLADPATQVVDKLHQVAYRTGLGNSVFASSEALGCLSRADVKAYLAKHFAADRLTVVGTGVEHGELKALVEAAFKSASIPASSAAAPSKTTYFGGEARIEAGPNSTAIYAVAYPGASYTSSDYGASLVLKALLDGSKRLQWGDSYGGALGDAATASTSSTAFSHSYSDSGLVGFVVEGKTAEVKEVTKKSIAALKALASSVSSAALEAAKKAAIVDAEASLTRSGVMDALSKEAISGGVAALSNVSSISSVTAEDVQKRLKSDYLITNRRKDEDARAIMTKTARNYSQLKQKSQFEESTTAKINHNHFLSRFHQLEVKEISHLEARRQKYASDCFNTRLRAILEQDEIRHREELLAMEGNTESRIEGMRQRMHMLRETREKERKNVVQEKLEQQWRQNCDELRSLESKMLVKHVDAGRAIQIKEREARKELEKKEKEHYEKLWEEGRIKKMEREANDHTLRQQRNQDTLVILKQQLKAFKEQAQRHEELKAEEARLMRHDAQMRLLEDQRERERKEMEKRAIRLDLDSYNKARLSQRQKDVQEALETDIKILAEVAKLEAEEKQQNSRRRAELQREMAMYRQHLAEQRARETQREIEVERFYAAEQDRVWQAAFSPPRFGALERKSGEKNRLLVIA